MHHHPSSKKVEPKNLVPRQNPAQGVEVNLEPGHTPGRALIPDLIASLSWLDDKQARKLVRKLSYQGPFVAHQVLEVFQGAQRPQRARLLDLLVQIVLKIRPQDVGESPLKEMMETLIKAHHDPDLKTRFLALASACVLESPALREGTWPGDDQRKTNMDLKSVSWKILWTQSVLSEWEKEEKPMRPDTWRVFLRALSDLRDPKAQGILETQAWSSRRQTNQSDLMRKDEDLALLRKSLTILRRDLLREGAMADTPAVREVISDHKSLHSPGGVPAQWKVVLACRQGLESLVQGEIARRMPWVRCDALHGIPKSSRNQPSFAHQDPTAGVNPLQGDLSLLWISCRDFFKPTGQGEGRDEKALRALWELRIPTWSGLFWPVTSDSKKHTWQETTALWETGIKDRESTDYLRFLAQGKGRFRLDTSLIPDDGKAHIWPIVDRLNKIFGPFGWSNDPKEAPWSWHWCRWEGSWGWLLIPREGLKKRFAYRRQDVPASSHAPLAAALALMALPTPEDTLWDPFCGAGTELLECRLLETFKSAWGFDTSPEAIASAQENTRQLEKLVGSLVSIHWVNRDATHGSSFFETQKTSPSLTITNPPYGKRVHRHQIQDFYRQVIPEVLVQIPLGGRLVWITPFRDQTDPMLKSLGFDFDQSIRVDLGGFWGYLQKATRREQAYGDGKEK